MKKKIIFVVTTIAFAIAPSFVSAQNNSDHTGGGIQRDPVASVRTTAASSLLLSMPFVNVTIADGQYIDADMLVSSGVVEIKITDCNKGIVAFKKSVNVAASKQARIDISNLPNGEYAIEFKNKNTRETLERSLVID